MLTITTSRDATQSVRSRLDEALQVYERCFGWTPDWLNDLAPGRILTLIHQALKRGAPLTTADLFH